MSACTNVNKRFQTIANVWERLQTFVNVSTACRLDRCASFTRMAVPRVWSFKVKASAMRARPLADGGESAAAGAPGRVQGRRRRPDWRVVMREVDRELSLQFGQLLGQLDDPGLKERLRKLSSGQ